MDYRSVLDEVESWPIDERIRLLNEVWDGIEEQGFPVDVSPKTKDELQRRIEGLDRNPASAVPWEKAKERVLKRIRQ